jgi:formate hydrogenlyase subunit 6/NADH:ubiquinone oxidoreductase subunit I
MIDPDTTVESPFGLSRPLSGLSTAWELNVHMYSTVQDVTEKYRPVDCVTEFMKVSVDSCVMCLKCASTVN